MAALRRTCFQITLHSASPLIRASFTYSLSSTSSIAERISLIRAATQNNPKASVGKMNDVTPPLPEVGTKSSCTAKIHISISPSQKGGADWPISAIDLPMESNIESRRTADNTPMGTAITVATAMASAARRMVLGNRSLTRSVTG